MKVNVKDINEEDSNTLLYFSHHQRFNARCLSEIVVHGAIIQCNAGSHYRYMELPVGHGVEAMGMSAILESDCIPGKNIPDFGICAVKTMMATSTENFKYAAEIPGTIKEGALTYGIPCSFIPLEKWRETDKLLTVYNVGSLQQEGEVLTSSNLLCNNGAVIDTKIFSGQAFLNLFDDDAEYLSDHELCKIKIEEGDPIQIEISKNTITINVYIRYENANRSNKKLIKDGIKKWGGTYKYVFGHTAKVKIKIKEVKEEDVAQKCIIFKCIDETDCQAIADNVKTIDTDENGSQKRSHMKNDSGYDYGQNKNIILYPIQARGRFRFGGTPVKDENGIQFIDVRKLTDIEYTNAAMHEFGHAMGLYDAPLLIPEDSDLLKTPGLDGKPIMRGGDIMYTDYLEWAVFVSCINIQMIITAANERKMQFHNTNASGGTNNTKMEKSKGVDIKGVIEECQRKEER